MMIIMGIALLTFDFIEPYYKDAQNWLIKEWVNQEKIEEGIILLFEETVISRLIYFSGIFLIFFWISVILYFAIIKRKYITTFSCFILKQNWWKIIYVPALLILFGYYTSFLVPLIGKERKNKSYFLQFTKAVKIDKITDRFNKFTFLDETEASLNKIKKTNKKDDDVKKATIRFFLIIKNDLKPIYKELEKNKDFNKTIKIWEKESDFKKLNQKKADGKKITDQEIEKLLENTNINSGIEDILENKNFWEKKDNLSDILKDIRKKGFLNLLKTL